MSHTLPSEMRIYSYQGQRLYIAPEERERFIRYSRQMDAETKALCLFLVYTGCRISEALGARRINLQRSEGIIAIESAKKRQRGHIRELPIPPELVEALGAIRTPGATFWSFRRTTAWRRVKEVMEGAGIEGPQATAKGLRHSFGVHCVLNNIHLPVVQKWMGHSDIRTTAIYTNVCGAEERLMAERLWD